MEKRGAIEPGVTPDLDQQQGEKRAGTTSRAQLDAQDVQKIAADRLAARLVPGKTPGQADKR